MKPTTNTTFFFILSSSRGTDDTFLRTLIFKVKIMKGKCQAFKQLDSSCLNDRTFLPFCAFCSIIIINQLIINKLNIDENPTLLKWAFLLFQQTLAHVNLIWYCVFISTHTCNNIILSPLTGSACLMCKFKAAKLAKHLNGNESGLSSLWPTPAWNTLSMWNTALTREPLFVPRESVLRFLRTFSHQQSVSFHFLPPLIGALSTQWSAIPESEPELSLPQPEFYTGLFHLLWLGLCF